MDVPIAPRCTRNTRFVCSLGSGAIVAAMLLAAAPAFGQGSGIPVPGDGPRSLDPLGSPPQNMTQSIRWLEPAASAEERTPWDPQLDRRAAAAGVLATHAGSSRDSRFDGEPKIASRSDGAREAIAGGSDAANKRAVGRVLDALSLAFGSVLVISVVLKRRRDLFRDADEHSSSLVNPR